MIVEQIENLPYSLIDVDYDVNHVMDLIGHKKLIDEYSTLFEKLDSSGADIDVVYGCDGIPYLGKGIDLLFLQTPTIKVMNINNKVVGFFKFHDYEFKTIAKDLSVLKRKFEKYLKDNYINYHSIYLMEIG